MNRKSNFLISVLPKGENPVVCSNPGLNNYYKIITGNSEISLYLSENTVFAKSINENIFILFSGNIYQDDLSDDVSVEKYLLEKYLLFNKDFVKYLNGSFCLFFAQKDTGDIYFATDRLNTRKIFSSVKGRKLFFATDINYFPLSEYNLNYSGVSSYLINGAVYNDLTLFKEIKILERASLHKIIDFKIISEKYWDYYFTNEYENKSEAELSDELYFLYLKSLKRRIRGRKNIFVSLSGGYDSRGIAAMINEIRDAGSDVICFSHNFGDNTEGTDAGVAHLISEKLGFSFTLLNSYNGNPYHTIEYNAKHGQGMAYFCVESDAWEQINKDFVKYECCILLVGDMNDGTFPEFHGNKKRALERTQIFESEYLKEFDDYFSPGILKNLCESWDEEYNKILNKFSNFDNMVNLLDYLYIDQRIPHVNSVARECFQMPFIETTTPFYDNEVLDFMRKLPYHLRDNKKLHRITFREKYPELFRINFAARGWGNESLWINEIKSFSNVFIENINCSESMLDEIIQPGYIIKSLISLNSEMKNGKKSRSILKSAHNTFEKIFPEYHSIIESIPGGKELTRKAGKYVSPRISNILPKIFILRLFLERNNLKSFN